MSHPKMKTFVNSSHVKIESLFNAWASAFRDDVVSIDAMSMNDSSALQKFVFTVVYTENTKPLTVGDAARLLNKPDA